MVKSIVIKESINGLVIENVEEKISEISATVSYLKILLWTEGSELVLVFMIGYHNCSYEFTATNWYTTM